MGRVMAICIKSARNDANAERNEDRDTLPVSIICSHADFQPESMPENRPRKASFIDLA